MEIKFGNGTTEYGPGVAIELTGDEVALAIDTWLVAHGVHVSGPRTVTVNGELCEDGHVYVDPSGFVISAEGERFSGRGSWLIITPEMAESYLINNKCGRGISKDTVTRYARKMADGKWISSIDFQVNEEIVYPIFFDTNGALLDGQHRLLACIQAGVPFETEIKGRLPS